MPANRPLALGAKGEKRALVGNLTMPMKSFMRGDFGESADDASLKF